MRIKTRHLRLDARAPAAEPIQLASRTIRAGGLVAFPTETVYGLGANALDAAAVAKIFAAKGRPSNDPLIAHIADIDQLPAIARDIPAEAYAFAQRFWPGPLTLVLPKSPAVPPNVTAGLDSVAARVPDHPVARALLEAAALPIAAPSANRFARPSPTRAQHVLDDLDGAFDLLLDAGPTSIGVESTILSLVECRPRLLRPGGLPLEELRELAPDLRYEPGYANDQAAQTAPGQMLRHYSPRARVLLFQGEGDAVLHAMRREALRPPRAGLLLSDADALTFEDLDLRVERLGADADEAAFRLFAGLRALDRAGVERILVRACDEKGRGLAVRDRLLRAAVGQLIEV